jgi:hypothetical protein
MPYSDIMAARARKFTLQLRGSREAKPVKVAKIIFSERDGSLFLDFPYKEGLVCRATMKPGSSEVSLQEGGGSLHIS